jgi:hypothetical protein
MKLKRTFVMTVLALALCLSPSKASASVDYFLVLSPGGPSVVSTAGLIVYWILVH